MDILDLEARLLELCYKHKLSHLGSYFSSLPIINEIYSEMNEEDIFILSSGHCALALYTVLEKYKFVDAEELFLKHGGHPHRDEKNYLFCSTGSLGMGITVAVGRAIANKKRKVYCLISDGECAEGSVWEALRYINESKVENIEIYVNMNGYCAYDSVDSEYLKNRILAFYPKAKFRYTDVNRFDFLRGLNAHYHVMGEKDYLSAISQIENSVYGRK